MIRLPDADPLLTLAVVLVAGVGFGALAKLVRLPGITGQILAGVLIGPALGVFDEESVRVRPLGELKTVRDRCYAISPRREMEHPAVARIVEAAKEGGFGPAAGV